jgi:hypothetical protein
MKVLVVDYDPKLAEGLNGVADPVTIGDADRDTIMRGGLPEAWLVIL